MFRRNLKEHEENQYLSRQTLLRDTQIPEEGEDIRIWKALRNEVFSVSSFFLDSICKGGEQKRIKKSMEVQGPTYGCGFWMVCPPEKNAKS